jgi:hypothetical protein
MMKKGKKEIRAEEELPTDEPEPDGNSRPAEEPDGNGHLTEERILAILSEQLGELKREVRERFEELEKKTDGSNQATVIAAKMVYDTPPSHKRRFTRISLRMVDPFSLADACHAVLDDDVQKGRVSLGQIRRESIYDHLNSVQGQLRDKATELALQQEQNKAETAAFEEANMGKGL